MKRIARMRNIPAATETHISVHTRGAPNNKLKFRATVEQGKQNLAIDETPVGRPSFSLPLAMESVSQSSGACPKTGLAFGQDAQDSIYSLEKISIKYEFKKSV